MRCASVRSWKAPTPWEFATAIRSVAVGDGRSVGIRQTAPVGELFHVPGDGARPLGDLPQALAVDPAGGRDADSLADRDPQVEVHAGLGHVLMDLAVREPRQLGVLGRDQGLRLGGPGGRREPDRALGSGQPLLSAVSAHGSETTT